MTLIVSTIGDNPQQPAIYAETYVPDQLVAGNLKIVSQQIVLVGGSPLPRGTVIGRSTSYSVIALAGTNTGNGTVGSISTGVGVLVGAYVLTATGATTFDVVDPEGNALANATVGTAYTEEGLSFTVTAGGTAFVAGDSFTLNVEDAIGTFKTSVKTASDGSQNPIAILSDYSDPSSGAITTGAYFMGEFNINAISYDNSWTPELLAVSLPNGLFLKSAVTASDPGTYTPAVL